MGSQGKKKKSYKPLLILIVLMLALIAASCVWLFHRGMAMNEQKTGDVEGTVAEAGEAAGEALSSIDGVAETLDAAKHVYPARPEAGSEEELFKAYDEAISAGAVYLEAEFVNTEEGLQRVRDVFDRYERSVSYIVDLKSFEDSGMLESFRTIVEEYGYADIITAKCEDLNTIRSLENIYPDMPKLYVCKSEWGFDTSLLIDCIDIICVNEWLMNADRCRIAHEHGRIFSAWVLESEDSIRNAIELGADTYFARDPALAIRLEKEHRTAE